MGRLLKETPLSEIVATLELLDHLGVDRDHLARLRSEPNYAKRVAEFMLRGVYQKIMGGNFLGIEESVRYFGVKPTEKALASLKKIPFSEDTLVACKDKYILVADFGLSILDIQSRVDQKLFSHRKDAWCNKESFTKELFTRDTDEPTWRLVRKYAVSGSFSQSWQEQELLLPSNEETPKVRTMVYAIILYHLLGGELGERLFEDEIVRCGDVVREGSNSFHVCVGNTRLYGGVDITIFCEGRCIKIGLASSRKFPKS